MAVDEIAGVSGAGGVSPTDQVLLHFSKIEFVYKQQRPDGCLGDTTKTGWIWPRIGLYSSC
jgi:type VI protein secretion system component Hcp